MQAVKDTPVNTFSFSSFAAFVVVLVSVAVLQVCMSSKQPWLMFLSCWLGVSAFGWLLVPLATGESPNQDQSFVAAMKSAFVSACINSYFIYDRLYTLNLTPDHALYALIAMLTFSRCWGALSSRFAAASSAPQCGRAAQKYYHI